MKSSEQSIPNPLAYESINIYRQAKFPLNKGSWEKFHMSTASMSR